MLRKTVRSRRPKGADDLVTRPTAFTLVLHIIRALLVDGLILLVSAIAALTYLYQVNLDNDMAVMLIGTGIALIALLRGCAAWQVDLTDYRKYLAMERHKSSQGNTPIIPALYNSRRY
jgi:hypothetical protein